MGEDWQVLNFKKCSERVMVKKVTFLDEGNVCLNIERTSEEDRDLRIDFYSRALQNTTADPNIVDDSETNYDEEEPFL
ncbi:hypothetical protein J6590_002098 [Homalodisca vitripennis]|nr:hypothetical protein J6590_002098 [Homalodisca vitripennis]